MSEFALKTALPAYLREEQNRIEKLAAGAGLDFFPTVFEILTYDQMNEIAAYGGFPNRYPHWRFGMEYERLAKGYEYGLSKIYEMVINNNPSYAYLLEGNSLVDQKLVMAHVYAHVDFFKNNYCFRSTDLDTGGRTVDPVKRPSGYDPNRRWIDKMANHGSRMRRVVSRQGINKVEEFVDHCLSLENLIDLHAPQAGRRGRGAARHRDPSPSRQGLHGVLHQPGGLPREAATPTRGGAGKVHEVPGAPRARRSPVRPRARAARTLGARRSRGDPGGSLLLRAAVADEDHERGLGHLLALALDDRAYPRCQRDHRLRGPRCGRARDLGRAPQPVQARCRA